MKIDSLRRKIPDIGGTNTPQTFITLMEEKGFDVISSEPDEFQGNGLLVDVPEKGLHLIFIQEHLCKEIIDK